MKRIIALVLVVISALMLVSCFKANDTEETKYVITCGDTKVDFAVFYSELYNYKNDFLFNYLGLPTDNAAIWGQESPSGNKETVGESLRRMALEDTAQFAWVVEYAKDNGVVLSEDDLVMAEENYNSIKENLGDDATYQKYLDTLKFTDESLKEHIKETLYYDKGFTLLTGENGLYHIPDEDYENYYKENFYSVKHIFINDLNKEDEEGNLIELTEEEKKEKAEKADEIYADLQGGMSFDALYMLSEDGMSTTYPDGITFTFGMIESVYEEAVKALKPGEFTKINGGNGGIYILQRVELIESDIETYGDIIASAVSTEVQERIYADHKGEIDINYDMVNACKVEDIPAAR